MFYRKIIPEHSAQEQPASFKVSSVSKQLIRKKQSASCLQQHTPAQNIHLDEDFFFSKNPVLFHKNTCTVLTRLEMFFLFLCQFLSLAFSPTVSYPFLGLLLLPDLVLPAFVLSVSWSLQFSASFCFSTCPSAFVWISQHLTQTKDNFSSVCISRSFFQLVSYSQRWSQSNTDYGVPGTCLWTTEHDSIMTLSPVTAEPVHLFKTCVFGAFTKFSPFSVDYIFKKERQTITLCFIYVLQPNLLGIRFVHCQWVIIFDLDWRKRFMCIE